MAKKGILNVWYAGLHALAGNRKELLKSIRLPDAKRFLSMPAFRAMTQKAGIYRPGDTAAMWVIE